MRNPFFITIFISACFLCSCNNDSNTPVSTEENKKNEKDIAVMAYYFPGGNLTRIDSFPVEKLSHIIFSFCHLKGNRLSVDNAKDTAAIQKLVGLKQRNAALKIILSLGGWGGCEFCSDVFSTAEGRKEFIASTKEISEYFKVDGLDLDWEYPTVVGFPGHKYQPADKQNFTSLVRELRQAMGKDYQLGFAAGGYNEYLDKAVEWDNVMKEVNHVNMMTYDLVNGYSTKTGHHTPLYSTKEQIESTDNAIQKLLKSGVPAEKIIVGAAFYGRMWENVPDVNNGLYQQGKFKLGIDYKDFSRLASDSGFVYHWDDQAKAPYLYNPAKKLFVTYDDPRSIGLKTKYVIEKGLGGIMFWELGGDLYANGLLEAIDKSKQSGN